MEKKKSEEYDEIPLKVLMESRTYEHTAVPPISVFLIQTHLYSLNINSSIMSRDRDTRTSSSSSSLSLSLRRKTKASPLGKSPQK